MIEWLSVSDKSSLYYAIVAYNAYDKAGFANSQKALQQQLMDNMNKVTRELPHED